MEQLLSKPFEERAFRSIERVYDEALDIINKRRKGLIKPLVFGFPKLNRIIGGGINKSEIITIGGRPGVGKSAFSLILIHDIARIIENKNKYVLLFWNFEMPAYQQILRLVSNEFKTNLHDLQSIDAPMTDEKYEEIKRYKDTIRDYPFYFMDTSKTSEFIYRMNKELQEKFPDKVMLNLFDHTRLVSKSGKQDEYEESRITDLYATAKALSSEIEASFIFLSQLNRNIENIDRAKEKYIPKLTDFFGADSVAQYSTIGIILQRPEMYNIPHYINNWPSKDLLAVHILKNRHGYLGCIPFQHNLAINDIKEL